VTALTEGFDMTRGVWFCLFRAAFLINTASAQVPCLTPADALRCVTELSDLQVASARTIFGEQDVSPDRSVKFQDCSRSDSVFVASGGMSDTYAAETTACR
jgi:hypothetical protein